MSKIKLLPDIISNKIAAGEVVARPASVVKELIENSLDAESTSIILEVEKGGRSLIRVSDNGTGMSHDDALLAIERYATSKIFNDSDLFAIKTFGFRGEALPSIASVSKFNLVTNDGSGHAGISIFVNGGKITKVTETGAPPGTMICINNLFFNIPARRKFLKTINTEMGHITETMANFALARPEVKFKLIHNGRVVKNFSATLYHEDRIANVLGKSIANDLFKIQCDRPGFKILGWIAPPTITRSTSGGISVYVNGRFVRDRLILHAILEGYRGKLMKGRYPVAILFIKLPPDQVDVNVHPTKSEVRFNKQKQVHDHVAGVVSHTVGLIQQRKWSAPSETRQNMEIVSEPDAEYGPSELRSTEHKQDTAADKESKSLFADKQKTDDTQNKQSEQRPVWKKKLFGDLRVIGQLHDTYIICESTEGLVLVDQHAAHERIIFEQLKSRFEGSVKTAQKLLIPETLDMDYRDKDIFEKLIPDLQQLGLEIEPFGGNTFVIKSVPAILTGTDIKPLIKDIVESFKDTGFTPGLSGAIEECIILAACHGAIRANQRLSGKEIRDMFTKLDECDNPSCCPHGRPVWISLSMRYVEKSFKRIV